MKNRNMTLAIINGIGNVLATISIVCLVIFLTLSLISGFTGWRKEYLIYSIIGAIVFFIVARICKMIIRNSEK